jgi:hypothetical protein
MRKIIGIIVLCIFAMLFCYLTDKMGGMLEAIMIFCLCVFMSLLLLVSVELIVGLNNITNKKEN